MIYVGHLGMDRWRAETFAEFPRTPGKEPFSNAGSNGRMTPVGQVFPKT